MRARGRGRALAPCASRVRWTATNRYPPPGRANMSRASDRELRDALAATYLAILRERNPGVVWVREEVRPQDVSAATLPRELGRGLASPAHVRSRGKRLSGLASAHEHAVDHRGE